MSKKAVIDSLCVEEMKKKMGKRRLVVSISMRLAKTSYHGMKLSSVS